METASPDATGAGKARAGGKAGAGHPENGDAAAAEVDLLLEAEDALLQHLRSERVPSSPAHGGGHRRVLRGAAAGSGVVVVDVEAAGYSMSSSTTAAALAVAAACGASSSSAAGGAAGAVWTASAAAGGGAAGRGGAGRATTRAAVASAVGAAAAAVALRVPRRWARGRKVRRQKPMHFRTFAQYGHSHALPNRFAACTVYGAHVLRVHC